MKWLMWLTACSAPAETVSLRLELGEASALIEQTVVNVTEASVSMERIAAVRGDARLYAGVTHELSLTPEQPGTVVTEWYNIPAADDPSKNTYASWTNVEINVARWRISGTASRDGVTRAFSFEGGPLPLCRLPAFEVKEDVTMHYVVSLYATGIFRPFSANPQADWLFSASDANGDGVLTMEEAGEFAPWIENNARRLIYQGSVESTVCQ